MSDQAAQEDDVATISPEDRNAVLNEIRLIVIEALRDLDKVRADGLAKIVASTYPRSGMTSADIAERISAAALAAGIPVERRSH
jgi:hypothetical protein